MRRGIAAFSTTCTTIASVSMIGCSPNPPAVAQFGEMRAVMREGHTESRIPLADAIARPHAVGVGALEGLAGEITIVDGDVWVSRVTETGLRVTGPDPIDGDRATLLTLAHVPRWQAVTIDKVAEGRDLESLIERTAHAHGIDTTKPFPFMIEGNTNAIEIHVINGYCPVATDPATVDAEPWRWSSSGPLDVVIVGFFAPDMAGVMTHHGTAIHAHAVLSVKERTITGHVERLSTTAGMILRVPAVD